MKRVIATILIAFGWASAACAATPGGLTTLRAIHALSHADARMAMPVLFEATVTYYNQNDIDMFVQDGDTAIYVQATRGADLVPGDRVLVEGHMRDSFRPDVFGDRVTLLHHGVLPAPVPATFDQMIRVQRDCMLVKVRAVVRSADLVTEDNLHLIKMHMVMDGGDVDAFVVSDDVAATKDLLDAEVEVTAVVSGNFDSKMQLTGILLEIPTLTDVRILKHASANPWTLPITSMDQVLSVYHVSNLTQRVRVHGVITYYQPGMAVVLQNGPRSIWISTHTREPLEIGDKADVTGFPDAHDQVLTLTDGEVEDRNISEPVKPRQATWQQLGLWSNSAPDGYQDDLVSIEGQLTTEAREATQDEYVLVSGGRMLTAIYHHPPGNVALPPMMQVPLGSKIRVTGICTMLDTNLVNPGEESSFNILLRSFDDIEIVARPSWVNVRNLMILVGLLMIVVLIVGARGRLLDLKVKRQALAMAARIENEAVVERRRSSILEDINGKRPVAEILQEIVDLISFRLDGAPCWCRIANGPQVGEQPPDLEPVRIVREQIPVRSVSPLGEVFAGLDLHTVPSSAESEILSMGAGLAFLAIESRRVYSDLFHRSEFDLLTGLHNRFSFEKRLKAVIDETPEHPGIFGLVYIDLDEFKSVNDQYGHRVGDMYLQEVALRMKRQLRNVDLLARHGGDEFTAFVPAVRSRADVEEITERLRSCFTEAFALEGCTFHGSASFGIAMYPEDGESMESLLSTADAAMYVSKHTRHETGRELRNERR
ncbi:MAG: GGDEF domain-containing protein [Terracidiphilus sp.]